MAKAKKRVIALNDISASKADEQHIKNRKRVCGKLSSHFVMLLRLKMAIDCFCQFWAGSTARRVPWQAAAAAGDVTLP